MSTTSQIIFKAFLDSCAPENRESLQSFLPASLREVLDHLSPPFRDATRGIDPKGTLLDAIHTSWFEPFLRRLAAHDLALVLAAISREQCAKLSKDLGFSNSLPSLTPSARSFLRRTLLNELKKERLPLLPLECLPQSPFNRLLSFSYAQKIQLIDLLSMYDLAAEMKRVIEKEKLALITHLLSNEERTLLNTLSQLKDSMQFKSMNLNQWDGNPETLRALLRQRGINRLSKATFGTEPSFQWYLCHHLDTTSAALYKKLHTSLDNEEARKAIAEQVLSLMEIFNAQLPKEGPHI